MPFHKRVVGLAWVESVEIPPGNTSVGRHRGGRSTGAVRGVDYALFVYMMSTSTLF